MNQGDSARLLRVSICLIRCAVGGPARMTNPNRGQEWLVSQNFFQGLDLALGSPPLDFYADNTRYAG